MRPGIDVLGPEGWFPTSGPSVVREEESTPFQYALFEAGGNSVANRGPASRPRVLALVGSSRLLRVVKETGSMANCWHRGLHRSVVRSSSAPPSPRDDVSLPPADSTVERSRQPPPVPVPMLAWLAR